MEFRKEVDDYFCRFTFGQFVALILLELVTLFFVFYLGARFGPDLIGGRGPIAKSKPLADSSSPIAAGEREVEYTYPRVLPDQPDRAIRVKPSGLSAKEFDEEQRRGQTSKSYPIVVPAPEAPAEELKINEPASVKPEPKKNATEETVLFSIQVGAFRSSQEATTQMDKWRTKGYSTFMTVGDVPNKGTWYRVRIGRFTDLKEANGFLKRFKEKERIEALVVPSKG
jgi:cell division septation protein DedD